MKRLMMLLILISLVGISSCKKETVEEETQTKWVVIGYMDGNNNLDEGNNGTSYVIKDVQDLESIGSSDEVKIIVAVGSKKKGGIVKYYYIEKHQDELPDSLSSKVLMDLGTKDMSDKRTLKDFLQYVKDNYEAEHYLLVIDDHGGGWQGCCVDEVNGAGSLMPVQDIRSALQEVGLHPEVIVFHACLMSMVEVTYELKEVTDYVVASEFSMPMLSVLNPQSWLAALSSNPDMSSLDVARNIAKAVYDEGVRQGKTVHMAVIKTDEITSLGAKLGNLANNLVTQTGDYANEIYEAWGNTHVSDLDDPNNVDVREFVLNLKNEPNIGNIQVIKDAIDSVVSKLNDAVPYTWTNAQMTRGGLTVYLPIDHSVFAADSAKYVSLKFKETNWFSFVSKFTIDLGSGGSGDTSSISVSGSISDGLGLGNYYLEVDFSHDQNWDTSDSARTVSLGNNSTFSVDIGVPSGYGTGDYVGFIGYSGNCYDADGDGYADDLILGFYPDDNGSEGFLNFQNNYSNVNIPLNYYIPDYCTKGENLSITKDILDKVKKLK